MPKYTCNLGPTCLPPFLLFTIPVYPTLPKQYMLTPTSPINTCVPHSPLTLPVNPTLPNNTCYPTLP